MGNPDLLTCEECRELAEANDDTPDCDNCVQGKQPVYSSQINYDAINVWHELDLFGRDIDSYCGVPMPLKLEAIIEACKTYPDPNGLKWRIMLFEQHVYSERIKKFNADMKRRRKK